MSLQRVCLALLAALMLFVQQGAVLHELGHALELASHHDGDAPPEQPHVCDLCAAYAGGGAAVPPVPLAFHADAGAEAVPDTAEPAPAAVRPRSAHRPRAPPFHLV